METKYRRTRHILLISTDLLKHAVFHYSGDIELSGAGRYWTYLIELSGAGRYWTCLIELSGAGRDWTCPILTLTSEADQCHKTTAGNIEHLGQLYSL